MTLTAAPPLHVPAWDVELALLSADYSRAEGRIDVVERDVTVRSCRFVHIPGRALLRVHCAVDGITYVGHGDRAHIERPNGSRHPAVPPTAPRDIPNWLLCPALAPIWGRPGDGWRAALSGRSPLRDGAVTVPLRALDAHQQDGYLDVVWPDGHLRVLALGDEHYVLRELDRDPIRGG
jgi:hypothetical protein